MLPQRAVKELLSLWHTGIVRQVSNCPIDLRIERWLLEECAGMSDMQRDALRHQLREDQAVLTPEIESFTARSIYEANVIMNHTFALRVCEMLDDSSLQVPYPKRFAKAAEELLAILDEESEDKHRGDVRIVNRWAQRLGIRTWYTWVSLDGL